MNLTAFWPHVLVIPALLIGAWLGWQLRSTRRRADGGHSAPAIQQAATGEPPAQTAREARARMDYLEQQLAALNRSIVAAREQFDDLNDEHARLLLNIDAKRADVQEARSTLDDLKEQARARQSRLLADIDESGEELDVLERMNRSLGERINNLTQQYERQKRRLELLQQTIREKTSEIHEAEQLIEQRDADLRRLIDTRQQREADILRIKHQANQQQAELRNLLELQRRRAYGSRDPRSVPTVDVTPLPRPRFSNGPSPRLPSGDEDENGMASGVST
jgi:chromosome segregation ATPase